MHSILNFLHEILRVSRLVASDRSVFMPAQECGVNACAVTGGFIVRQMPYHLGGHPDHTGLGDPKSLMFPTEH